MVVLRKMIEVENQPSTFCLFVAPLSTLNDKEDSDSQYVCSREILETSLQWMVRVRRRWHGLFHIKALGYDRNGELVYESHVETHLFQWIASHSEHGVIHGELGQVITQPLVKEFEEVEDEEAVEEWMGMLAIGQQVTVDMMVDETQQLGHLLVLSLVTPPSMIASQHGSSIQSLTFLSELPGSSFFNIVGRREVFVPSQGYSPSDIQHDLNNMDNASWEDKKRLLMTKGTFETQLTFPNTVYMERIPDVEEIAASRLFVRHESRSSDEHLISKLRDIASTSIKYASNIKLPPLQRHVRVCMWSNSVMDGQRTIWLQLLRSLDPQREKYRFSMLITHTPFSVGPLHHLLHNATETSGVLFADDVIRSDPSRSTPTTTSILPALRDIQSTLDPTLQVGRSPLDIYSFSSTELQQQPTYPDSEGFSGSIVDFAAATHREQVDMDMLTEYAHRRFVAANGVVSRIEPSWVCRLYRRLVRAFQRPNEFPIDLYSDDPLLVSPPHSDTDQEDTDTDDKEGVSCDMMLLSNGKGLTTDVLITDAARSVALPVLLELPNLSMHPSLTATAVVSPSHYALRHPSMAAALLSPEEVESGQSEEVRREVAKVRAAIAADYDVSQKPRPVSLVIAPSVDTDHFRSLRDTVRHDTEEQQENETAEKGGMIVRIGFIGRLVEGKNPGLFLLAAKLLYERMSQVRFVVVGSGQLLPYLKELCVRLQLEAVVQWVPWVQQKDLPPVLDQLHIVFNPSLVESLETFCIANIECMSMGIPLVTFAVGGIGEYFSDEPVSHAQDTVDSNHHRDTSLLEAVAGGGNDTWTVTRTGVLLHKATPSNIADALQYLAERPSLRGVLGRAGRRVVETRFTVERQMSQYERLFDSVHSAFTHAKLAQCVQL